MTTISKLIESIELDIGGRVNVEEPDPESDEDQSTGVEEVPELDQPVQGVNLLEEDSLGSYLTVQKRDGNERYNYEYCFRVDGTTAYLTTLTRMEDGKDCERYWVPEEVRNEIQNHHPDVGVVVY